MGSFFIEERIRYGNNFLKLGDHANDNRLLLKPRIGFSGQEGICEKPELWCRELFPTLQWAVRRKLLTVHEDFEPITDEPSGLKATVSEEPNFYYSPPPYLTLYPPSESLVEDSEEE